jgi:anti-sigma-K factor RskA
MTTPEDLDWLAHLYLLDEMSEEEAAAFEERLSNDEEAAAALSRGVVLLEAVREVAIPAYQTVPVGAARPARRRQALAGFVATAVLIGLVCFLSVSKTLDQIRPDRDAAELVSIWREAAVDVAPEAEVFSVEDDPTPLSDDVPDWLMAAVALDASASDDDEILEN